MEKHKVSVFWFRRDLRLEDNHGLFRALQSEHPVLPVFIFDESITSELPKDDARISFIYDSLYKINELLVMKTSGLLVKKGEPIDVWNELSKEYDIQGVYANEDYEPYAIQRDRDVGLLLSNRGIEFNLFKDQVIYEKGDVLKGDRTPYTVYTPYKNKWLEYFSKVQLLEFGSDTHDNFITTSFEFPSLIELGFTRSKIKVLDYNINELHDYKKDRDYPALSNTSYLSPHLRFGSVSVRKIISEIKDNPTFLSELIWREFFMQILYHYPEVIDSNFKRKYDGIQWRNNPEEFEKWKKGETGYPMVDAGMRELNATGYMHNRVRMVVAGFLCKHLLIDWRWGEAYFAEKLLDYELASNNGNWQWAAGTGCDAAPYFRVFNPTTQLQKFDKDLKYIKKWVPELDELSYPEPMVDHKMARERAIKTYKVGLESV